MKSKPLNAFWNIHVSFETFNWTRKTSLRRSRYKRFFKKPIFKLQTLLKPKKRFSKRQFRTNNWIKLKNFKIFSFPTTIFTKKRILMQNIYLLANSYSFISIRNILNRRMFWWLFLNKFHLPNKKLFFKNFKKKRKIEKIKFKPGYILIWKRIRLILMYWIGVRFPYPTRFTRFLLRMRYPALFIPFPSYSISVNDFLLRLLPFQFGYINMRIMECLQLRINTLRVSNFNFKLFPFDWVQFSYNFIFIYLLPHFFFVQKLFLKKFWKIFRRYWYKAYKEKNKLPRNLGRFFAYTKIFPQTFVYYESDWQVGLFYLLPIPVKKSSHYYSISPISWTMYNWKYIT